MLEESRPPGRISQCRHDDHHDVNRADRCRSIISWMRSAAAERLMSRWSSEGNLAVSEEGLAILFQGFTTL